MNLARGDRFRITKRGHWGFGRVFEVHDLPGLNLAGNPDSPVLTWRPGEVIEFRATLGGRTSTYLIHAAWVQAL